MDANLRKLVFKTIIFIFSMCIAWVLLKSDFFGNLVASIIPLRFISEFVAGMLYASFFTSPVSVAMIIILARENNPIITALLAGFGAAFMDLVIIKFFKKELSSDIGLVSRELRINKLTKILVRWKMDFIIPLLGAIIIASPFPDELGLVMLGASRLKYQEIAILTYFLNTAGILVIVVPANVLLS